MYVFQGAESIAMVITDVGDSRDAEDANFFQGLIPGSLHQVIWSSGNVKAVVGGGFVHKGP